MSGPASLQRCHRVMVGLGGGDAPLVHFGTNVLHNESNLASMGSTRIPLQGPIKKVFIKFGSLPVN